MISVLLPVFNRDDIILLSPIEKTFAQRFLVLYLGEFSIQRAIVGHVKR